MRARLGLLALVGLATACNSDPSFDKHYDDQSKKLDAAASNIQAELNSRLTASQAAGRTDGHQPD